MNLFQDFKPQIKLFLLVALVAVVISAAGILLLQSAEKSGIPISQQNKALVSIAPEHQNCVVDSDCVIVSTKCSTCECGAPVNVQYAQQYKDEYTKLCSDYHGGVCDFYCPTPFARCLSNRCVLSAEQAQETIDTSGWQTYRNEKFSFEVRYPPSFEISESYAGINLARLSFNPYKYEYLSIGVCENSDCLETFGPPNVPYTVEEEKVSVGGRAGTKYSYQYEKPSPREVGRLDTELWRTISGEVPLQNDAILPFYLFQINAAVESDELFQIFDQILSTFRFVEDKPGIPVTDELLEKMKEKLLKTDFAKTVTRHSVVEVDLDNDGIEEIVATWVPSEGSIPEFGIFQIVDIEGNYKKIASFDFHIFSSPLAMDVPVVNIAEDINGDGMSEIHVGWLTGSVRPTSDDVFLIFDPQRKTLFWMEVVDKQGRQVPSHFMGARGANSGGTWFYRLAVGDLDTDQALEIVQIYQNSTSLYETGNIGDTDWRVEVYDWDGSYYRYSEALSAAGKGTLPQKWMNLKTISFVM